VNARAAAEADCTGVALAAKPAAKVALKNPRRVSVACTASRQPGTHMEASLLSQL
jgi:hypothetical protein